MYILAIWIFLVISFALVNSEFLIIWTKPYNQSPFQNSHAVDIADQRWTSYGELLHLEPVQLAIKLFYLDSDNLLLN